MIINKLISLIIIKILGFTLNTTYPNKFTSSLQSWNVEPDSEHVASCCLRSVREELHRPASNSATLDGDH